MNHRPRILRHQGHAHGHDHGAGHLQASGGSRTRLLACFALTAVFLVVEAAAGWWTNSLALLSDAFHMLSDSVALGLAALAAHISLRRPTPEKTYGFRRFEVLAAFTNAVVLLVLGVGTAVGALGRLWNPQPVHAGPMLGVAAAGLALNLIVLLWLHQGGKEKNLNEESALWHVLGDALGSLAALAAGGLMLWKGWMRADAAAGLLISGVLLFGAQRVLRRSAHILVEGAPPGVDAAALREFVRTFPQIGDVHDFHVWTMTGRDLFLSAHIEVASGPLTEREVVAALNRELALRGVSHGTLQAGACGPDDCAVAC